MKNTTPSISFFIAKIFLRKKRLFGFRSVKVSFFVTPSLKIFNIDNPNNVDFLYSESDVLNVDNFSKWVCDNGFEFEFLTKSKKLKRILILDVSLVIDTLNQNKSKSLIQKFFKYVI